MKVAIVMGTRPEIIKLSPIINSLTEDQAKVILTGQHYDYNLSLRFVDDLGLRRPDFSMNLVNSNPAMQMGEMTIKLSKILLRIKPDTVIVQGDTNTVFAASIASIKNKIPVSHVESGLRSFDWRMPEEHNRIEVDHISELLFAPTQNAKKNLISEKVHGKIFVTGNTVIDAIDRYADISHEKSGLSIDIRDYILTTLHRSENVDDKNTLNGIVKALLESRENFIFPVHPRTLKRLCQFGLYKRLKASENILLLEAVGYFEMLELMKNCTFILTDSGGIQEEATSPKIRKKVLVVRKTTDRPESVSAGLSELVGTDSQKIGIAIRRAAKNPTNTTRISPYGTGNASKKIIQAIQEAF